MSSYLSSIDVYSHPISTSYANSDGDSKVQALPGMDFTMTHNYGSQDIAAETAQYVRSHAGYIVKVATSGSQDWL